MTIELRLLQRVRIGSCTTALPMYFHGVPRDKFRLFLLIDWTYWYCLTITEASSKVTSVLWTASR
jgi:hypothetical protein